MNETEHPNGNIPENDRQQNPFPSDNGNRGGYPSQDGNNGYPQLSSQQQPSNVGYGQQGFNNGCRQNPVNGYNRQYGGYNYNRPQKPVYDRFMYEPIGFEELERQNDSLSGSPQDGSPKKQRSKGESTSIVMLVLLIIISAVVAVFGIVHDIIRSDEVVKKIGPPKQIVMYKEPKPAGAINAEHFKDENGKYTTEGASALVRPSIVKIYTYTDYSGFTSAAPVGTGSGIVLNEDGYIVTNAHVLKEDGYHRLETVDGEFYDAKIVGRDSKTDIAVIKITADNLTPATLGDSDEAVVGEQVIAIGNPANLSSTVTDGIISAVNRKIRTDSTGFEMDCIQTNADISPGNSGGALVNMYGQVIGITSSKYVSAEYEGLGFAITINEATPVIEQLIKNGYVSGRFKIGIQLLDMGSPAKIAEIEKRLGTKLPDDFKGIYIEEIDENSDIYNTELKPGDFITAINGKTIMTYQELYDTISSQYAAGDTVPATCAHIDKDGNVSYYEIAFKLIEDTSGNY